MKNKCKLLGHKWIPVFIKGSVGDIEIKIAATYCNKCWKGKDEVNKLLEQMSGTNVYNTYSEKYFK